MPSNDAKLDVKKGLLEELKVHDSGYIIVQKEILQLLIEAAPIHLIQTSQRILEGLRPTLDDLDPESPTINWDVKVLRRANKISQAKLAKEADMEQPDISEFERGGTMGFSEDRKKRIIKALKTIMSETNI